MTNFKNTAEIGDTIRGYDFPPMDHIGGAFYIVGNVTAKGTLDDGRQGYTVLLGGSAADNAWVAPNKNTPRSVFVPFEVERDWEGRIEKISK